jgi:hypothetical protein
MDENNQPQAYYENQIPPNQLVSVALELRFQLKSSSLPPFLIITEPTSLSLNLLEMQAE